MYNVVERIEEIVKVKNHIAELIKAKKLKEKPLAYDKSKIPELYKVYLEYMQSVNKDSSLVDNKKKFVFVVVLFYYPNTFAGDYFKRGLRDIISNCIGVVPCLVSRYIGDIYIAYKYMPEFRTDVNNMIEIIENKKILQ